MAQEKAKPCYWLQLRLCGGHSDEAYQLRTLDKNGEGWQKDIVKACDRFQRVADVGHGSLTYITEVVKG